MKSNILSFEDYRIEYAKWLQTVHIKTMIEQGDAYSGQYAIVDAYMRYLNICGEYSYEEDLLKLLEDMCWNYITCEYENTDRFENFEREVEKIMNK